MTPPPRLFLGVKELVELITEELVEGHAPESQRGIIGVEHTTATQVGDPLRLGTVRLRMS